MAGRQAMYKLVLLGESAVGKSSIVLRFVKSQFYEYQEATIGGQERYHSLAPMYYRGAQAAVVVYDITNVQSYNRAMEWVTELRDRAPGVKVIALAGNKCDLHQQRLVSTQVPLSSLCDAEAYAQEHGLLFMETSAKTATNVMQLFTAIGRNMNPLHPSFNLWKPCYIYFPCREYPTYYGGYTRRPSQKHIHTP
ncbi:unnamed protein product [Dibothriocephalus latus]|uniref:Uncharacterized protein n=1 Tax=Dibothriocephalus latus TaxID=60516 RepID=A0A3P7LH13_DIBLA|nr:unnamed protein product [Dibothriocephalus latus]